MESMFRSGWVRVTYIGRTLYLHNEFRSPMERQKRVALDMALETGRFDSVLWDDGERVRDVKEGVSFAGFLKEAEQIDWLGVTRGMFPDGQSFLHEGKLVYEAKESGRLIQFTYYNDPNPKVFLEFLWSGGEPDNPSKKDRVASAYKSMSELKGSSVEFMRKIRDYFLNMKRMGVGVEFSAADYMDEAPRRERLFGKMLHRSGFELSGVTKDDQTGDRHLFR